MTLEERYTVQKDEYYGVDELLISPDSSLLIGIASAEWSTGLIDVWDLATGEKLLERSNGGPNSFALHPTEPALMFKRYDGSEIHYWRLGTDTSEAVFSDDSAWWRNDYTDIDFNNDGSILAAVHSGVVEFWDVLQGIKLREDLYIEQSEYTETVGFNRVVFSPDGDLLAVEGSALDGVSGGSYIHLWDMNTLEFVGHLAYDDRLQDFAFSADGTIIATYHIRDEFEPAPI